MTDADAPLGEHGPNRIKPRAWTDTLALHAADEGISVDSAVDVAKEAADIVLCETGLDVLVHGIEEGRKTLANTLKYMFMAASANFGNMFSMAGASLFLPFLPTHRGRRPPLRDRRRGPQAGVLQGP